MISHKTLQRDNQAAVSTRTITIDDGGYRGFKYLVTVHTDHKPKRDGFNTGPEHQEFGLAEQHEAIDCAAQQTAMSEANGYVLLP